MQREQLPKQSWTREMGKAILPYIERSFSGSKLRSLGIATLLVWLASGWASFVVVTGDSSVAMSLRQALDLESEHRELRNWEQCGFCVTVDSDEEKVRYAEEIAGVSSVDIQTCLQGERFSDCDALSYPWLQMVRMLPKSALSADADAPILDLYWKEGFVGHQPTKREAWNQAQALDFRPKVEVYHSPLGADAFTQVWGLVCSFLLLCGAVVLVPLRVAFLFGKEIYHGTWTLLIATQQPVTRIVFALMAQALVPLLMLAAPLWLTVVLTMLGTGQVMASVAFTLACITLLSLWASFGVTLPALAARHTSPALLMMFSLVPPAIYLGITCQLDVQAMDSGGNLISRLFFHSGLDQWNLARFVLNPLAYPFAQHEAPQLPRMLASVGLVGACLLWIRAQAGRIWATGRAGLSRKAWFSAWFLAGFVLGARWWSGLMGSPVHNRIGGGFAWQDLCGSLLVVALLVPLASYLRCSAHPLAHRPQDLPGLRSWFGLAAEVMGAMLLLLGGQAVGAWVLVSFALAEIEGREVLLSVFLLIGWSVLVSGVSLLMARGLFGWRSKLAFGLGSLVSLGLIPGIVYHLVEDSFDVMTRIYGFTPTMVFAHIFIYLVAVSVIAWTVLRRPRYG